MKILHTSDWHLGKSLHERSMVEDQQHSLEQVHEIIRNDPHDALIISGDIYDRSLPPTEAVRLLSWFLTTLREFSTIPVLIIPGNHDSAGRLSYCADLMVLSNIYFQTDPEKVDEPVTIEACGEKADIYMIPFLDPSTYHVHRDLDEEKENSAEERVRLTHEDSVKEAVRRIHARMNGENINILAAHLFTLGGMTSESERRFVGHAGSVAPEVLEGFDYIALGHLHKPQRVSDYIYYPGSLAKYSFSESGDTKQVLSIDIGKNALTVNPKEIHPFREMVRLKDTYMKLMHDEEYKQYKDSYIEAELLDSDLVINPISSLRERFPYVLSVRQKKPDNEMGDDILELPDEDRNLETDFVSFHKYIYDEEPGEEKMSIFIEQYNSGVRV
ncbi:MAG: exonuclease SbcCD subunit D [bacterium]|nr:exonuclease SbcCD subunit D [bacterium]